MTPHLTFFFVSTDKNHISGRWLLLLLRLRSSQQIASRACRCSLLPWAQHSRQLDIPLVLPEGCLRHEGVWCQLSAGSWHSAALLGKGGLRQPRGQEWGSPRNYHPSTGEQEHFHSKWKSKSRWPDATPHVFWDKTCSTQHDANHGIRQRSTDPAESSFYSSGVGRRNLQALSFSLPANPSRKIIPTIPFPNAHAHTISHMCSSRCYGKILTFLHLIFSSIILPLLPPNGLLILNLFLGTKRGKLSAR